MAREFKSNVSVTGDLTTSGVFSVTASSGLEGGEIRLAPATAGNTTISGNVVIDIYGDKLRFFEQTGTNRGYYIDITAGGAGVTTNLAAGGGGGSSNSFTTISVPSGTNPVATTSTDTLTLTAGTGITITGTASTDTVSIATNGASANGASTLVLRDATGNFTANTITATTFSGSGASLTNIPGANVTGTLTSTVLGNSTAYIGTTAVALNRASGNLALTGISSVTFPGSTSGTILLQATATAGTTTITMPATTGTVALTANKLSDFAATTSAELAGVISNETGSGSLVFGTGPTITPAAAVAATSASTAGYIGMPQNSKSGAYTLVAGDAGKHIYYTLTGQTVTIPANSSVAFEIGTTITFITPASVSLSIAITTDTMYLAGTGSTGTRTLAAYGMATAVKVASTTWIISGNGLT